MCMALSSCPCPLIHLPNPPSAVAVALPVVASLDCGTLRTHPGLPLGPRPRPRRQKYYEAAGEDKDSHLRPQSASRAAIRRSNDPASRTRTKAACLYSGFAACNWVAVLPRCHRAAAESEGRPAPEDKRPPHLRPAEKELDGLREQRPRSSIHFPVAPGNTGLACLSHLASFPSGPSRSLFLVLSRRLQSDSDSLPPRSSLYSRTSAMSGLVLAGSPSPFQFPARVGVLHLPRLTLHEPPDPRSWSLHKSLVLAQPRPPAAHQLAISRA
mmetsp:Transcript_18388/g.45925  ORF Transcript_18388/g.45925 Transcript_18388/m.45925 type:complete len:269 (-) Transcript_18388:2458-3264(-)